MEKQITINMSLSTHGTVDVFLYGVSDVSVICKNISREDLLKFFQMMDIWNSSGYDRYNDGGLYFELPLFAWDHLDSIQCLCSKNIKINKIQ